jgi:dedicator of cytokinesis protein 3
LDGSYLERHPQDGLAVQQLRQAVLDYVRAIQEALSVHRELCKDLAFHEALKSREYTYTSS